jgi:transposase
MPRTADHPQITAEVMAVMLATIRCLTTPFRDLMRFRIVLLSNDGRSDDEIAEYLHIHVNTVRKWRRRFIEDGLDGLKDVPRGGRPKKYDYDKVRDDILDTLKKPPPKGHSHWLATTLSVALKLNEDIVGRVLRANNIKLDRWRTWCVSTDPRFEEKAADIVGLYTNPPPNSVVVCVDEKTSMQALERPNGFVGDGRGRTVRGQKHTYKRHGILNLFAGLDIKNGTAFTKMYDRKRRVEFVDFMDNLYESVPGVSDPDGGLELHVVLDNYCIHYKCDEWLAAHGNVVFHYTPTSASWLNMVEIMFGKLTRRVLRRGNFKSIQGMADAINAFMEVHNEDRIPYRWKKLKVMGPSSRIAPRTFAIRH